MKAFFSLIALGLLIAAGLTLFAGALNELFDWQLGLGIGGFDIALPDEFGLVVALSVALAILAGIFEAIARADRLKELITRYPGRAASSLIVVFGLLGLLVLNLAGGQLGLAVESGDVDKVRALLSEQKPKPETLNPHLYQTLKQGRLELAQVLLDAGADLNHKSGEFSTPLLGSAVLWFPRPAVEFLLDKGADPNQVDSMGRSPALLLVLYRKGKFADEDEKALVEMLGQLKEHGADLQQADQSGKRPADIAADRGYKSMQEFLQGLR